MTIVATIEARMTSSRLPGKMALPIGGDSILGLLIERLKRVPELDAVVLATTVNSSDDILAGIAEAKGAIAYRGSEHDVLGRVRGALDYANADVAVEITGDCPLSDPNMISTMITEFQKTRGLNSYIANTTGPLLGSPHGLDVQVFEAEALRTIEVEYQDADAREHVSLPFYRDGTGSRWAPRFIEFFPDNISRSVWLSLDYREDYELIRNVHEGLDEALGNYGSGDLVRACLERPTMTRRCLALRGW